MELYIFTHAFFKFKEEWTPQALRWKHGLNWTCLFKQFIGAIQLGIAPWVQVSRWIWYSMVYLAPITFSSKLSCFLFWAFILFMVFVLCLVVLCQHVSKVNIVFLMSSKLQQNVTKQVSSISKHVFQFNQNVEKTSAIDFKTSTSIWCCLVVSFGITCMINRKPTKLKDSISMVHIFKMII
jgi:hypothetical protein